mmetsp:Transcript_63754/g.75446  ORF Transcript_63754/g.75446 Transcript_63754/m.75446 type:complete len:583 (+) Transcript_63754:294-2042(+)|eukprot:CAMPEP_0172504914 /NCGR_PEP_ID=MMETSP1066-20121228/182157_1 /TAXON_ID=671091 /ORGANISM="Coscinodiscus wailesii, Strain CCMP2513" /LENGTH=582 /DNA_ID=CAMNT_0013281309 /DNA_START=294 /DNA_END=2042 /DNA_ORIENTATION=+
MKYLIDDNFSNTSHVIPSTKEAWMTVDLLTTNGLRGEGDHRLSESRPEKDPKDLLCDLKYEGDRLNEAILMDISSVTSISEKVWQNAKQSNTTSSAGGSSQGVNSSGSCAFFNDEMCESVRYGKECSCLGIEEEFIDSQWNNSTLLNDLSAKQSEDAKLFADYDNKLRITESQLQQASARISQYEIELMRVREQNKELRNKLSCAEETNNINSLKVEELEEELKQAKDDSNTNLHREKMHTEAAQTANGRLKTNFAQREKELKSHLDQVETQLFDVTQSRDNIAAEQERTLSILSETTKRVAHLENEIKTLSTTLSQNQKESKEREQIQQNDFRERIDAIKKDHQRQIHAAERKADEFEKRLNVVTKSHEEAQIDMTERHAVVVKSLEDELVRTKLQYEELTAAKEARVESHVTALARQLESERDRGRELKAELTRVGECQRNEREEERTARQKLESELSTAVKEKSEALRFKSEWEAGMTVIENLKKEVSQLERSRQELEQVTCQKVAELERQLVTQREEHSRDVCRQQSDLTERNDRIRVLEENVKDEREDRSKELHQLETGIIWAMETVFEERRRKLLS